MFKDLEEITAQPALFEHDTAEALWADDHRSGRMLAFHLDGTIDVSSRKTDFLDRSSAWITRRFSLGPGKSVCDFGCGPGLYTSRFADSGADVTGIDFSQRSIDYARAQARRNGHDIGYVHGNYLDTPPKGQFDLITMIMCDYCALSPPQRQDLHHIWANCLKPDGSVLFDVYSLAAFEARTPQSFVEKNQLGHFWRAEDYYAFVNTFKYEAEHVMLDKYNIVPKRGPAETVYNWLQYFSLESLAAELTASGFEIDAHYGDVSGGAFSNKNPEFAVVVTKTR